LLFIPAHRRSSGSLAKFAASRRASRRSAGQLRHGSIVTWQTVSARVEP
jgi:hypothetical protein